MDTQSIGRRITGTKAGESWVTVTPIDRADLVSTPPSKPTEENAEFHRDSNRIPNSVFHRRPRKPTGLDDTDFEPTGYVKRASKQYQRGERIDHRSSHKRSDLDVIRATRSKDSIDAD